MAHFLISRWLLVLLLTTVVSASRKFHSRDSHVRAVIANCTTIVDSQPSVSGESRCQQTLECILNEVDAATSVRWSAGASILAFIPTVVALMSNSIDDLVLVAEDSSILAYVLVFCSITAFLRRFGGCYETNQELSAVKEDVRHHITEACVDG